MVEELLPGQMFKQKRSHKIALVLCRRDVNEMIVTQLLIDGERKITWASKRRELDTDWVLL